MTDLTLCRIAGMLDWWRIRRLYRTAFPASERKPFAIIRRMHRQGRTDVWVIRRSGAFAGFATTINSPDLILLDYLAVDPRQRGSGAGSAALAQLTAAYPGQHVFVEIESPYEPGADQQTRQRRRAFYERCGFVPCRTMASVFGVPMELLGHGCRVDFDTYHAFYCQHYNEWAGSHIKPLPYPDA